MRLFAVVDLCSGMIVAALFLLAYILFVRESPKSQ